MMGAEIRIIDGDLVRRLLDMPSCLIAMRQAFSLVSTGKARQPLRSVMPLADGSGVLGLMPGALTGSPSFGIKIVSVFPKNFDDGKPTHQGMVVLFDASDGRPLAIIDAHAVTALRTAAASAVATDALARPDSQNLALLGYGTQATAHLQAIRLVRPLTRVTIWGRHGQRARAFAERCPAELAVGVADSVEQAIAEADIVCCLTAASEPILLGRWLRPGMHVNAVGASLPSAAEIDAEAVRRCRFFTDCRDSAEQLAGEFRRAIAAEAISADHMLGEIGDILNGTVIGRSAPDDITCFKSLGMAAEDLVAAEWILHRAREQNLGVVVSLS